MQEITEACQRSCRQEEQERRITVKLTRYFTKEFPQNITLGGHTSQAMFFHKLSLLTM